MDASDPAAKPWPSEGQLIRLVEKIRDFTQECTDCQQEAPPHWQFCATCGARLGTACPNCSNPLPPVGARFCPYCGLALPEASGDQAR